MHHPGFFPDLSLNLIFGLKLLFQSYNLIYHRFAPVTVFGERSRNHKREYLTFI